MSMALWLTLGSLTAIYSGYVWLFTLGLNRLRRGRNRTTPAVSVVIAARDEGQVIRGCLESLLRQTYPGPFDITVADDGSSDDTAAVVAELAADHPQVKLVRIAATPLGWAPKKYALDQAIAQSHGRIILATDADCILPPTWIEGLVGQMEPAVGMVAGLVEINRPDERGSLWVRLQALELFSLFMAAAGGMAGRLICTASGGNLAYRRETFQAIAGFDSIRGLVSGDDDLLLQRMAAKTDWRARFSLDRATAVSTAPQESLASFFRQRRRWASKARHQRPGNLIFLLVTFLFSLALLLAMPTALVLGWSLTPILACLAVKACFELILLWRGARRMGRTDLLAVFPLWELLHIPYVVLAGLLGLTGPIHWKGRRYRGQEGTSAGLRP